MRKNILIIDDDESIRKSFILAFEDTEYNVLSAESGEEGIKKVQSRKCDLIFTDLKMPGMNGVETLREIRKINKDVPIYVITAFHKEFFDQLKNAKKDGMNFEALHKPIGGDKILLVARSTLEGPVGY